MELSEADLEQAVTAFEDFLRGKRLKMTDQRRQMVRAALEKRGHFTAEELHRKLSGSGEPVSMATVYRGLSLLEDADLIEGHDFADGLRRYERALDREHHDHMICVDCRAVVEFTDERIEELQHKAASDHGFDLSDHSLTLFVKCRDFSTRGSCERRDKKLARQQAARSQ